MTKKTRGRASKVDLLPPEIKSCLTMMLRDKQYTQADILQAVNELIEAEGLSAEQKLSKSGLNRYSQRMEKMSARFRESRETAEIWVKQFGEAPQGDVGKLLIELVKQLAFDTTMALGENEQGVDPMVLNRLALLAQRIESAEMISFKREQAIRQEVVLEASEKAGEVVAEAGLSKDTVAMIKRQILGISDEATNNK